MPIHCIGFNHKTTNISLREKLAFSEEDACRFMETFSGSGPDQAADRLWDELVVLSTCNRVEVYAVSKDISTPDLKDQLASFCDIRSEELEPYLYEYIDEQAVGHLFRVAAGLDSMVIGESQILGQVTHAHEIALAQGASGKTLSRLMQAAIHTGKRVRAETTIGERSVSVSSLAARLVSQKVKDLSAAKVVLLGAGEMAELAVESLHKRGVTDIHILNRTIANACALAERWQGEASTLESLPLALQQADVLISSTSAPHPIISGDMISRVMAQRNTAKPLIIIDIAVPRDVHPEVGDISNVHLYDIDILNHNVESSLEFREREIPKAEEIIIHEINIFLEYLAAEKVIPVIIKLRNQADQIRRAELEKALKRMPDLRPQEQEQLVQLTQSIVNKMLHMPTKRLREESSSPNIATYSKITQALFGLEDTQE
ncbi:MAG: glutamyl-tRNA reductase [Anaerolineae bacterium]|nr:glutamyl-tRNA reductase [Anaerolineae bacterium]